jgi:methylmalonyl-CoA mutase N-terminal domain/subunit
VAVEKGFFQGEIAREAYRVAKAREAHEELVVGVNVHEEGNPKFDLFPGRSAKGKPGGSRFQRVDPGLERRQVLALQRFRANRDAGAAQGALLALRRSTESGENVLPHVLNAVRSSVTLGEIAGAWREIFGEYRPPRSF